MLPRKGEATLDTITELETRYSAAVDAMEAAANAGNDEQYEAAKADETKLRAKLAQAREVEAAKLHRGTPVEEPPTAATPTVDDKVAESPKLYRNMGEQLGDVIRAGKGHQPNPRLLQLNDWSTRVSGMSESIPADGGFLLQTDFSTELIRPAFEADPLASRCRTFTLSTNANSIKIPAVDETSRVSGSRWGGIQVYWETEGESTTGKKIKLSFVKLELKKMKGVAYLTSELLEDAPLLESWVSQAFPEEMGFMLADAIVRGDGASQPLGFLNAACLVTVAKETGQVADTVTAQNIIDMWARMVPACKPNSVWLINSEVQTQLPKLTVNVGTGGSVVYMPAGGLSSLPYGTLYGRPVLEIEQASALGDVGDISLVDLSQYYLARKRSIQAASSIHVKFVEEETALRWSLRVDGQPAWKSALTPYKAKAGNTISPFIALAAR